MWNLKVPGLGGSDFSGYQGLGGSMAGSPQATVMGPGGGMDVMGTMRKFSNVGSGSYGGGSMFNPMGGMGYGSG